MHGTEALEWCTANTTNEPLLKRYSLRNQATQQAYAVFFERWYSGSDVPRRRLVMLRGKPVFHVFDTSMSLAEVQAAVELLVIFGDD